MKGAGPGRGVFRVLVALAPTIFAWPALRQAVESRMALQMLLQFPLLLASGWAVSMMLGDRLPSPLLARWFDRIDAGGLLGATVVSCVSAFWMLPAALDASLLSEPMRMAKFASWWLAGAAWGRSAPRLADEAAAFFGGNLAWMLATAGLLYQAGESRLCVGYLLNDQVAAGQGLIVAALIVGAATVHRLLRGAATEPARAAAGPREAVPP